MAFPTTGILDDFTRGDTGPPPSGSWTDEITGLKVVSNEVGCQNNLTTNIGLWTAAFGPACEAYCTVSVIPVVAGLYVLARWDSATNNAYAVNVGATEIGIYRFDAGAGTQLGSNVGITLANGDKVGIRVTGSTIESWYKAVAGSWTLKDTQTDATYAAAGRIGLLLQTTLQRCDDFGGGTIVAGHGKLLLLGVG